MSILVLGEDKRMLKVANEFNTDLCDGIFSASEFDIIILPYVSQKGDRLNLSKGYDLKEFINNLKSGAVLFGGGFGDEIKKLCKDKGVALYDLFDDEELTEYNAYLTALGAIDLLKQRKELKGKSVYILGYGRVAKACADELKKESALLSVVARKEAARKEAKEAGYASLSFDEKFDDAEIIINTVPSSVLNKEKLCECENAELILDLASSPYGTDFETAKTLKIEALTAPALPARAYPEEAGKAIAETVKRILGGDKNAKV